MDKVSVLQNEKVRVLFLPPSDVYVRSFLHLLYTLIKLYCTKKMKKFWGLVA